MKIGLGWLKKLPRRALGGGRMAAKEEPPVEERPPSPPVPAPDVGQQIAGAEQPAGICTTRDDDPELELELERLHVPPLPPELIDAIIHQAFYGSSHPPSIRRPSPAESWNDPCLVSAAAASRESRSLLCAFALVSSTWRETAQKLLWREVCLAPREYYTTTEMWCDVHRGDGESAKKARARGTQSLVFGWDLVSQTHSRHLDRVNEVLGERQGVKSLKLTRADFDWALLAAQSWKELVYLSLGESRPSRQEPRLRSPATFPFQLVYLSIDHAIHIPIFSALLEASLKTLKVLKLTDRLFVVRGHADPTEMDALLHGVDLDSIELDYLEFRFTRHPLGSALPAVHRFLSQLKSIPRVILDGDTFQDELRQLILNLPPTKRIDIATSLLNWESRRTSRSFLPLFQALVDHNSLVELAVRSDVYALRTVNTPIGSEVRWQRTSFPWDSFLPPNQEDLWAAFLNRGGRIISASLNLDFPKPD